ncbi:MAG: prepilin-type N-terminal cleavage/methylation domain-containing protein, partial [Desulfobacterales bacterium]
VHRPAKAPPRCVAACVAGQTGAGLAVLDQCDTAGLGKRRRPNHASRAEENRRVLPTAGFTLLELIVVILLLSILLGFAIPAFQAGNVGGSPDSVARELAHAVKRLKIAALHRQSIHRLHLDLNQNRIWVTREEKAAPDDEAAPPRQSERILPEDIRIAQVRFADDREVRSGTAEIAFYPQGYSDRAVIRLTDDGDMTIDLIVEAFLPMALIAEEGSATVF